MPYADNLPSYIISCRQLPVDYKEIDYSFVSSGEAQSIGDDDITDPREATHVVQINSLRDRDGNDLDTLGNKASIRSLLSNAMTVGCSCDHDCCGHRFTRATAEHLAEDFYKVTVYSARNY